MSLYEQWRALAEQQRSERESAEFWNTYFGKEKDVYQQILAEKDSKLCGTVAEFAGKHSLTETEAAGFLDGINDSLVQPLDLEKIEADTQLEAEIDFERLYRNMLRAKAPWLYELTEWEGILSPEKRHEILRAFRNENTYFAEKTPGRNDPCPCGSGKKYKNCCGKNK